MSIRKLLLFGSLVMPFQAHSFSIMSFFKTVCQKCTPTSWNPLTWGHPNFHVVESGKLYRSKTLEAHQYEPLIKEHQIKAVLILREVDLASAWYKAASQAAIDHNASIINIELNAMQYPTQQQLQKLFKVLRQNEGPLLIHCKAGADRTGLACALWKLCQNVPQEDALEQLRLKYCHVALRFPKMRKTIIHIYKLIEEHGSLEKALVAYNHETIA